MITQIFVRRVFSLENGLFNKGLKDGIAIGVSYIPLAAAVSIAAAKQGLGLGIWELMSALLYSGSSQSAILNLIAGGETAILAYILTFSIITCRHILLSLSLSQKMDPKMGTVSRMLFASFNTDEIYAIAMQQPGQLKAPYLFGLIVAPFLGWMLGVNLGFIFTQLLPESIKSAFGITLYAVFLALIVPPMRKSISILIASLCAAGISVLLECIPGVKQILSPGIIMMICTLVTCTIGAIFLPVKDEEEKSEDQIREKNI